MTRGIRTRYADSDPDFTEAQINSVQNKLTAEYVLMLRVALTGSSYSEMSEGLGLKIGTVKSRLNRARAALAKALAK